MNDNATGIVLYDLAPSGCPECGRPLGNRWLMTGDSGCATCDEAVTRHRCTRRPGRETMQPGDSWECSDCGSTWTAVEAADTCGECGQEVWRKTWESVEGDRIAAAPRYKPVAFTPFRDLGRAVRELTGPPACSPWDGINRTARPAECYRAAAGFTVHVKPGCRCR